MAYQLNRVEMTVKQTELMSVGGEMGRVTERVNEEFDRVRGERQKKHRGERGAPRRFGAAEGLGECAEEA